MFFFTQTILVKVLYIFFSRSLLRSPWLDIFCSLIKLQNSLSEPFLWPLTFCTNVYSYSFFCIFIGNCISPLIYSVSSMFTTIGLLCKRCLLTFFRMNQWILHTNVSQSILISWQIENYRIGISLRLKLDKVIWIEY